MDLPPAHYVAIPTENLRKATHNDIGKWQDMNVDEIANGFIHDDEKVVLVSQRSDSQQVRGLQQRVSREFAEQGKISLSMLKSGL